MAKKSYYAVRKGSVIGIFENWADCQAATSGYSNAEFKKFETKEEAEKYLNGENSPDISEIEDIEEISLEPTEIVAYVDGSYDDRLKKYAFGCVILTPSGETIKESGNGNAAASLAIRNIAGEMLGAMYAVKWAINNNYSKIEIRYDYEGIEKWVSGEWKAKNELAQKYAASMQEWSKTIQISFLKVAAHSNNKYNDMADSLAKRALTEGNGIPKIKQGEYWFTAEGIQRSDFQTIIDLLKEEYDQNLSITQQDVAHGISYSLSLSKKNRKKERVTVNYYETKKLMVQGKPDSLFSCIISFVTELVDIEDIPNIFNQTFRLNIDKQNVQEEFQYYLPNSYDRFDQKMARVLHQAVYNLSISGDMFDGTFLAQPALRVLEGHLKKIILEKRVISDNAYLKRFGFDFFHQNGSKYELDSDHMGDCTPEEAKYLGRCYTFYHSNRHTLEHWDDPTAPLDTTKLLDCAAAHDLIKRTLEVIDDYYTL